MQHIGLALGIPRFGSYIFTLVGSCLRPMLQAEGLQLTSASARTVEELAATLERLLTEGIEALLLKPLVVDDPGLLRVLDRYRDAGVPVLTLDSVVDHPAVRCTLGCDNWSAQAGVAEHVFERLQGRGRVVFLRADDRSAAGAARNGSFHALLARFPGLALIHEGQIDWVAPVSRHLQGAQQLQAALAAGGRPDAIVATNDEAALGAVEALQQAGLPLPLVSGFDGLAEGLLAVQSGRLCATVRQIPEAIARAATDAVLALGRGEAVPQRVFVESELVTAANAQDISLRSLAFVPALIQDLTEQHEQQRELQQSVIAQQSRVLAAVIAVSNAVRGIRDPARMSQALVDLLAQHYELARVVLHTLRGEPPTLQLLAESQGALPAEAGSDAVLAAALRTRQPQRLRLGAGYAGRLRSRLVLPLGSGERILGALELNSERLHSVSEETVQVFEAIASQIATALDNAGLYAETVRLAESALRESQARAELAERAQYLSNHDMLTGLPNRRLYNTQLEQAIARAKRYQHRLAVMFIDLDRFKQINDTLGHDAGDELLREVAARLTGCLRETDVVARQGGDEFVVMLPELPELPEQRAVAAADESIAAVARKILDALARPFVLIGQEFRVTGSVGIARYPEDGDDESTLTKHADIAMYHAKKEGKNNFQFYSERLDTHSLERLTLEAGLRRALERGELMLHYQAKREVSGHRVLGAEVLLRWEHPDLGTLAPMEFLPAAEDSGLIVPIGKWVMRQACLQSLAWAAQGLPALAVSVNLTRRQFADAGLLADVQAVLAETGLPPERLELEIGEGTLLHDKARTLQLLAQLKALGVRIAIDDFGAGYSMLSTLKEFPLDTIKIDRSCVHGITERLEDRSLTEAIIAMGRSLSLTIIAQGVETQEQVEFLRAQACDVFQGFYLNKPLPPEQFAGALVRLDEGDRVIG